MTKARGGGGLGGGHGGGTLWCGDGGGGGGGGLSPSLISLEQPLEREKTPFFLQMTARVCGGVVAYDPRRHQDTIPRRRKSPFARADLSAYLYFFISLL